VGAEQAWVAPGSQRPWTQLTTRPCLAIVPALLAGVSPRLHGALLVMRKLTMVCKTLVQAPSVTMFLLEALHVFILTAFADGTVLMHIRTMVLHPRCTLWRLRRANRAWRPPSELPTCPILPIVWILQVHTFHTSVLALCEAAIFLKARVPRILAAATKQTIRTLRDTEL